MKATATLHTAGQTRIGTLTDETADGAPCLPVLLLDGQPHRPIDLPDDYLITLEGPRAEVVELFGAAGQTGFVIGWGWEDDPRR